MAEEAEISHKDKLTFFPYDKKSVTREDIEMIYRSAADKESYEGFRGEIAPHVRADLAFSGGGKLEMSLTVVHFSPGFLLPVHAHAGDCLYYILQGTIHFGSRVLSAGEGFFVPEAQPYAYRAGLDGVKVLEFRTGRLHDFQLLERNVERWKERFRSSIAAANTAAANTAGANTAAS
jgi:quercetin dioxygenase-like cupin family protein